MVLLLVPLILVGVAAAVAVVHVRRRLIVVTVEGRSMEPTLRDGDRVLVRRCDGRRLRRGDVVVLGPPDAVVHDGKSNWTPIRGRQVKRVAALPGQPVPAGIRSPSPMVPPDSVVVLSDNRVVGIDSRRWGPYPVDGVVGVVIRRLTGGSAPRRSNDETGVAYGPKQQR
jgi:signal peptidase I